MFITHVGGVLVCLLLLAGCVGAPRVDTSAEADAIRKLDLQWQAAVDAKDIEACLSFYAPGAMQMPSNSPAFVGTEAIRKWYESWLMEPGVSNVFGPELVEVATSGDLAYERGTYRFAVDTPDGRVEDVGKYVVVWRKVNGEWKVVADIGNSDTPLPVR